ncbi:MFS transporter [Solirubrobacter sp. CPCC 204708]|uniref:MFS transporter n=1 Tax=Solirubrobacter deserti TaxID=2282478 RepID=A0ABT4RJK8_9ACTN|nr:MFS transporter [Solirubrobacter deserti]MBE2320896.1 MFS transporter [Solirubrobacter deserti]MDA0138531.1 MFS transporter [Solirubrobacter deserti]
MSAPAHTAEPSSRAWAIVAALSITETVSWGILYYAFAAFLVPMQQDLGYSEAQLTGAFSLALAVCAVAGVAVGRHLDRHSPRTVMAVGSVVGSLLVVAWSQVDGLLAFYLVWAAIGVVMAAVLYEPAFTVLAKHFPVANERRRAMTAMTLVAALASFIFLPLSQLLIDAHGWRDAALILAVVLAVITIPLHAFVLRPAPAHAPEHATEPSIAARDVLRSTPFWLLTTAFVLASLATIAMTVFTIPFLLERGHSPAFAAFAVGLIGVSQIPGRLLFAPAAALLPAPLATASVFALIALGVTIVVTLDSTAAVLVGLVILGMGNGMATLARATSIADLYGAGAYGTIASVAGGITTAARAAGPFAAALYVSVVGYTPLLWTLAALAVAAALLAHSAVGAA